MPLGRCKPKIVGKIRGGTIQIKEAFILIRAHEYKRPKEDEYDDSPWTREELQALAWEVGKHAGWEDMDEYDDAPEKP